MYTLNRFSFSESGILGIMLDEYGTVYNTLEHAYLQPNGSYSPKIAVGTYTCQRHAPNRLPYETFEVTNVPPFMGQDVTGILIHIGNYNQDSIGCILLGKSHTDTMITNSKEAFQEFMLSLEGTDSFELTIK